MGETHSVREAIITWILLCSKIPSSPLQSSWSHFVPCLPAKSYCCCNVPTLLISLNKSDTETWLGSKTFWPHTQFYSVCSECSAWGFLILRNSRKLYHQIKRQYKLLCLKYTKSELTTRQPFLHLCISSLWFLLLTLQSVLIRQKIMITLLMLCYLYVLKFLCSTPLHAPLPHSGPITLKVCWE